jgi:hypothetical protein
LFQVQQNNQLIKHLKTRLVIIQIYAKPEAHSPTYNAQDNGITTLPMLIFNMFDDLNNAGVLYSSDPMLSTVLSEFLQAVKQLNLDVFTPLEALSAEALLKRATAGNTQAQELIIKRLLAKETEVTNETLLEFANQGWPQAQQLVAHGYAFGRGGFKQDPMKLLELANQGWLEAQWWVSEGYAFGKHGIRKDSWKLLELANKGSTTARFEVAWRYAYYGYSCGQSQAKLLEVANKGWTEAQTLVGQGYANGVNGFTKDPEKLLELAIKGWPQTQLAFIEYANSANGLAKNEGLARFFEVYFKWKNFQLANAAVVTDGDGAAAADD